MSTWSYFHFNHGGGDRQSTPGNADECETVTPGGWGFCGTSTSVSGCAANGVGSAWDANGGPTTTPNSTGSPCLDGTGRGQQLDHMNGAAFNASVCSGRLNVTAGGCSGSGSIAWPHQNHEPQYFWNNSIGGNTYMEWNDLAVNNQDYYYDQTAQSGSFTGAAGTGFGLHSARPATCTPGPGGTLYISPTGSDGTAYFATDDNGGAGELWVCTSTNTWTGVYQPAVYPHPLASGTPTANAPTFSPSTGTPPQTVTMSWRQPAARSDSTPPTVHLPMLRRQEPATVLPRTHTQVRSALA